MQARATTGVGKPQADSEGNERIPPDGFGVAALEGSLYELTPPPPNECKLANAVQNKVTHLYQKKT